MVLAKEYSVMADFSIVPISHGETSVSRYVAETINAAKKMRGLNYEVTPMRTILEANNLETVFEVVKAAHKAIIAKGVLRAKSNLRIDDRMDKPRTMNDKVNAIKKSGI